MLGVDVERKKAVTAYGLEFGAIVVPEILGSLVASVTDILQLVVEKLVSKPEAVHITETQKTILT